jgi:hypothetical protein
VIEVALTTVREPQFDPPVFTVAPLKKPVPVIVTFVPPARAPAFGTIEVKVGAAW